MSGRLIITGKKTYCPWRPENIERVLRDERLERERVQKEEEAEAKARIETPKRRRRRAAEDGAVAATGGRAEGGATAAAAAAARHVNLFEEEERGAAQRAAEGEILGGNHRAPEASKSVGIAPVYLVGNGAACRRNGGDSEEQPFYLRTRDGGGDGAKRGDGDTRRRKEEARKDGMDPMRLFVSPAERLDAEAVIRGGVTALARRGDAADCTWDPSKVSESPGAIEMGDGDNVNNGGGSRRKQVGKEDDLNECQRSSRSLSHRNRRKRRSRERRRCRSDSEESSEEISSSSSSFSSDVSRSSTSSSSSSSRGKRSRSRGRTGGRSQRRGRERDSHIRQGSRRSRSRRHGVCRSEDRWGRKRRRRNGGDRRSDREREREGVSQAATGKSATEAEHLWHRTGDSLEEMRRRRAEREAREGVREAELLRREGGGSHGGVGCGAGAGRCYRDRHYQDQYNPMLSRR